MFDHESCALQFNDCNTRGVLFTGHAPASVAPYRKGASLASSSEVREKLVFEDSATAKAAVADAEESEPDQNQAALIGCRIAKKYDESWFIGIVCDYVEINGEILHLIVYDDGDGEHLTTEEVAIAAAELATWKTAHIHR